MCGVRIAPPGGPGGRLSDPDLSDSEDPEPSESARIRRSHPTLRSIEGSRPAGPARAVNPAKNPIEAEAVAMSITLARVGVRSLGRVWLYLSVIGLTCAAIGAGITYGSMNGVVDDAVKEAGAAAPEDPFVIGTPVPTGEDFPPVEVNETEAPRPEPRDRPPPRPSKVPSAPLAPPSDPPESPAPNPPEATTPEPPSQVAPPAEVASPNPPEPEADDFSTFNPDESLDGSDVTTDLYAANVRHAVRRYYSGRAQTCFDAATRNNPTLSGVVIIEATVGGDGYVTAAEVTRNTTGNEALGPCLANRVRTWRLPATPDGEPMTLAMPFSR